MKFQEVIKKIEEIALKKGANSIKLIKTNNIFIEDWVRLKCMFGCEFYARCFTCPPYSPPPNKTREIIENYKYAILVEFEFLQEKQQKVKVYEIMYELEREAFLSGLYKAFAYIHLTF